MLQPGAIVGGKFRIERILGEGGMGVVAVATHLQLDQPVALKVLHEQLAGNPQIVERIQREARASAKLRSEHVCRVSDVGTLENGAPYLVMELLEGADLSHQGVLPAAVAVDYVLQASIAIAEAHAAGIVHRDLKPANLFLARRMDGSPLVKVLDFGIAKAQSEADFRITRTAAVMGSPGYMSPEQLRSARDVDGRTDIWALGVILYELISGRLPFPAETITELAVRVSVDPPEPLDIDPGLRAVIFRCLEKDPAARFQTVGELAAALAPFGGDGASASASLIAKLSGAVRAPTAPASAQVAAAGTPLGPTLAASQPDVPALARTEASPTGPGPVGTPAPSAPLLAIPPPRLPAPKTSRVPLYALGAVVVMGGAIAAAVALGDRHTPEPPPIQQIDAPVAVIDAAPALDAAIDADAYRADDPAEVKRTLATMLSERNYMGALQLALRFPDDPDIADDGKRARDAILAQHAAFVDEAMRQHDCAKARHFAEDGDKIVGGDELMARTKACKGKAPPPAPAPDAPKGLTKLQTAQIELVSQRYGDALKLADDLVRADPSDADAAKVAGMAACALHLGDKAAFYLRKVRGFDATAIQNACKDAGTPIPNERKKD